MSALCTPSGPWSLFDWAAAPRKKPRRLRSFSEASELFQPGCSPRLTQLMPCWAASTVKNWSVCSLSPLLDPELVKPAASLSFHAWVNQRLEDSSAKAWKAPDAVPM